MAGRILVVCTANICRSPATAALLRRGLSPLLPMVAIESAGTAAQPGNPACDLSSALVGQYLAAHSSTGGQGGPMEGHRSRAVSAADLQRADLILALDRGHRSALARLDPASRTRTFTLRQAAGAAEQVSAALQEGSLPEGAPPLPASRGERLTWWVAELDAARAFIGSGQAARPSGLSVDPLDVPDPHVVGYQFHPMAVELIGEAVESLVESLGIVDEFGSTPT